MAMRSAITRLVYMICSAWIEMSPERSRNCPSRRERMSRSIAAEASRPCPLVDVRLPLDVQGVVADLVQGVDGDPAQGALPSLGVAVHHRPVPLDRCHAAEDV